MWSQTIRNPSHHSAAASHARLAKRAGRRSRSATPRHTSLADKQLGAMPSTLRTKAGRGHWHGWRERSWASRDRSLDPEPPIDSDITTDGLGSPAAASTA